MDIHTIDDFLTPEECDAYITLVREKTAPNFTTAGKFTNKVWTDLELAQRFHQRLVELAPCQEYLRPNELVMTGWYRPGESFGMHTDTGLYYSRERGEKTRWTLLIYLNDGFEGGETAFYDTESWEEVLRIRPERGKALLFDIDLWHRGLPVTEGEKYWIGCEIIGAMK